MFNADFSRMAEQLRFKLIEVTQVGEDVRLRLIPSQETL
jgi:diaminohydroxyphosphoribosylaminopyrimidine deaminase/5-amino-6-(5-phosphoribosylamino)uracil reductase